MLKIPKKIKFKYGFSTTTTKTNVKFHLFNIGSYLIFVY